MPRGFFGVPGWPLAFFGNPAGGLNPATLSGANVIALTGFCLPYSLTFSKIGIFLQATDNANLYDVGIYTQAGALVANIGAQSLPNGGAQTPSTLQGAQTITPGLYLFAWTGNATTAKLTQGTSWIYWMAGNSATGSAAGALPATIAASPVSMSLIGVYFWLQ